MTIWKQHTFVTDITLCCVRVSLSNSKKIPPITESPEVLEVGPGAVESVFKMSRDDSFFNNQKQRTSD